jgi:hypothetical protein
MESAARTATFRRPLVVRHRQPSPWARTVAVIRIPRFNVLESIRRKASGVDDPLAAFATEMELEATRRAW